MSDTQTEEIRPNADMASLEPLIGTWELSGDTAGTVTYERANDGFFVVQHFDMTLFGHRVQGLEVIGHLQPFGEEPGTELRSRAYDNCGNTLDYVYEMTDDTLTIWGGEKGSDSYFKATFNADKTHATGAWVYPGGGGYSSNMTRVSGR
jgi:hypothetical protein